MPSTPAIDLAHVARSLGMPAPRVQAVVGLLDEGNTVPFITRYRKDQTGGMDEEQIRAVQERVVKLRMLLERKQTILRSIESQGKLTPELAAAIEAADTTRRLEDLYLPFKPKKQTLATVARERGLELLAAEILAADAACADLDARARDFVNPDKQIHSAADALLGAGHILAETFSERAEFRGKLRTILEKTGKLVSTAVEPEPKPEAKVEAKPETSPAIEAQPLFASLDSPASEVAPEEAAPVAEAPVTEEIAKPQAEAPSESPETVEPAAAEAPQAEEATAVAPAAPSPLAREIKAVADKKKKKDKKKDGPDHRAFRDYFQYSEALRRVPPHRVLAINRGERAKALRVKVDADLEAMTAVVDELLVPAGHPHADFLRGCGRDALTRLVFPSLEREVRRELTDWAETHAVEVFIRNLRNLLLQPPVRNRRVLAVDPGFKSGCKLVALDEFGTLLDHAVIHLIGREERRAEAKTKLLDLVQKHQLGVIVIGNGTACRETEQWVSDLLAAELKDQGVEYVIVNEAGASVYSTSPLGRAEFPNYDATLRGAISIGRRLQDPLSELVKIDAANIGVGMYQHDVKAKHLRDSLDTVVESCVNYVGVDLNSASPALLRYVSGLNQLTAQRLYDHRTANGPFKSRDQLKGVSGIGEGSFVQAAGFLKIVGGDNPLDATWIHPESYPVAEKVLAKLGATTADLADNQKLADLAQRTAQLDIEPLAAEVQVGSLTLKDIVAQLTRPGRDPRESLPAPIFKRGVLKIDDLAAGMELAGTVLNVVDFGAFIDIGLKDSGLVHISQLADRYVQDPHQVVSVGDVVKVWVLEVDKQRRRVSLTMIQPGTRRPPEQRRSHKPAEGAAAAGAPADGQQPHSRPPQHRRPQRPAAAQAGQTSGQQGRSQGGPPSGGRPPRGGNRYSDKKPQQSYTAPPPPKPKPKPVVPLTKAMKEGKAPLRTFGDLQQFWSLTHEQQQAQAAAEAAKADAAKEDPSNGQQKKDE